MSKAVPMSVSFKPEMFEKIDRYCSERGCSRSWFVNRAVELFLMECLEDKEDYKTAEKAWNDYVASGEKGIPAEEVYKKLGL